MALKSFILPLNLPALGRRKRVKVRRISRFCRGSPMKRRMAMKKGTSRCFPGLVRRRGVGGRMSRRWGGRRGGGGGGTQQGAGGRGPGLGRGGEVRAGGLDEGEGVG